MRRRFDRLPDPTAYANPRTARLIEALLPLLSGQFTPNAALAQLAEPELTAYAYAVLMDEGNPELCEEAIDDAIEKLQKREIQTKKEEIRVQLSRNAEGKPETDDELLRRWSENARTLKGRGPGQDTDSE
ncbi:hypothetical protein DP117_34970 [Brasilonema sp. UFV-L1]|nr:hypothetical protein [Brasilonema sp. UFV-L1]